MAEALPPLDDNVDALRYFGAHAMVLQSGGQKERERGRYGKDGSKRALECKVSLTRR